MMKIVRIIARLNIGGPARNAVLLSDGLREVSRVKGEGFPSASLGTGRVNGGWETVLVCGEVEAGEGDMMYLAREKGIEPVIIKELGRELSWKDDWLAFWKIYKIICREKPDIIHTHTAKAGALGRTAGILYRLLRRNDASICHCEAAGRPRPEGLGYQVLGPEGSNLKKLILIHTFHGHVFSGYFGKIKAIFFIWIEKFLALFTDMIITVSEALKKELVEKYRIAPEGKINVIELGFELNELLKLPAKDNREVVNIGIVGRMAPVKNHKMLFKTAQILFSLQPSAFTRKVNFIVIGDGELRGGLERYAEELGMRDRIEFKGWVKDLKAIYEELDIVALTSLNEGTPVSLIEAMASGKPVVATKVGGVSDIVQDGSSGYLVESGDEEEFTKKLLELIKDPGKRREFGENGRDIVKNRFSKERLIRDTEKLYNNLLK